VILPSSIGRYAITGELGRGAMGVVYRALDPALERQVAIKVIAARAGAAALSVEELEARFLREARVAARINHPGVVTVHDAGRERDSLYLVMELIDGESLGERLARREFPPPSEAFDIVAQVADALAAAHTFGVVHRDIKPGNIMLTRGGKVKVADFGVAKAIGEQTDLTRTGTVVGSPAYMAPEQVRGEELDGRSDIFSLGVVLYELLLRRKPFPADTVTTLIYQILHDDPLADPLISRVLGANAAAFLQRCLAKRREERIPDAASFASGARALAGKTAPLVAETTGPTTKLPVPREAAPVVVVGPPAVTKRLRISIGAIITAFGVVLLAVAALIAVRRLARAPLGEASPPPTAAPAIAEVPAVTAGRVESVRKPIVTPVGVAEPMSQSPAFVSRSSSPEPTLTKVVAIFYCQRGAEFNVSPEDAIVTVEGKVIGKADDWDGKGGGRTYVFSHRGRHLVKLALRGYRTTWIEIVVSSAAPDEIADVDIALSQE
jgi:hypothetical protein